MCRSEIPATKTTVNFTESVLGHRVGSTFGQCCLISGDGAVIPSIEKGAVGCGSMEVGAIGVARGKCCLIVSDCLTVSKEGRGVVTGDAKPLCGQCVFPGGETMTSDSSRLRPAVVAGFEGHGGPAIEQSSSCGGVSSADDCGEVFVGDGDRAIFGLPHHAARCQFVQGDVRFLLGSARHRTDQWRVSAAPEHRDCIEYLDGRPAERCDPVGEQSLDLI